MREFLLGEQTLRTEQGRSFTCEYRVQVQETAGRIFCESYGISITLRETGEQETVTDITVNGERIQELGELLLRNGVTPCTLRDVINDWL